MSQDENPDVSILDASPKVAPEDVALRAQPRPVRPPRSTLLALLTGGLAVSVLAAQENWQNGDRVISAVRDNVQDSISQACQETTRRNLNIQPTLTERLGLPVCIIVNRYLVLLPYRLLFFNRRTSR